MASVLTTLVLLQFCIVFASNLDSRNVLFVIVSQVEPYHASVASRLRLNIEKQVFDLEKREAKVNITHEDFPAAGAWTITPLLQPILARYAKTDVRWVLLVEPHTAVRCSKVFDVLDAADHDTMWMGYPLSDEEPTIIHHFTFYESLEDEGGFVYPNFASGFAMRMELISTLHKQITSGVRRLEADFSIDPSFELAQLIYGPVGTRDPGPLLTPDLSFCVVSGDSCATYPRQLDTCGSAIAESSILFAVKTWRGFHSTRTKVVKKTWGRHVTNLLFFSDLADPSVPTIDIGIPNSKTGHCAKTVAILKYVVEKIQRENMKHIKWIFLADDDTILGVQRLCEVLSCYRGGDDVTVLGERYGYGYGKKETASKGYDYITGGGGTALSAGAARLLSSCACSVSAPDDMTLGACARRLHLTLTHSPLFHQARPQDYPRETLARDRPVSFHRHSSPDPLRVYATWFHHDDRALSRANFRDEL